MDNEIIYSERYDVYVRRDTHDLKSARECPSIVRHLGVRANDVVLDIGGHIGAFARLCARRGAHVVTVEPEPHNLAVNRRNTEEFGPLVRLIPAAVIADDEPVDVATTQLYVRGVTHTGLHTVIPGVTAATQHSITVPARRFHQLLHEIKPSVLKVDIEGGEWFFDWTSLPTFVHALHLEMHVGAPNRTLGRRRGPEVHAQLLAQGFVATMQPHFNVLYGTRPYYRRGDVDTGTDTDLVRSNP